MYSKHGRDLSEFPGDADSPAEAIAANEQRLHGPASKMAKSKDVKVAQDPLPCYHRAVYSIFLVKLKRKKIKYDKKNSRFQNDVIIKTRQVQRVVLLHQNHPHHDVSFPCGISQVWVQPVHESLDLVPVQKDEPNQKQEVHNTGTYREKKMRQSKENI